MTETKVSEQFEENKIADLMTALIRDMMKNTDHLQPSHQFATLITTCVEILSRVFVGLGVIDFKFMDDEKYTAKLASDIKERIGILRASNPQV